jgi:adenylate kinase
MTATYSSLNLVILGPPGSGKTTQSQRLAARYHLPHISTRDMLQQEVERETAVGREAELVMRRGELVSDRLLAGLILQRIDHDDCARGFILDGYPRTVEQATLLDGILAELGRSIERVVLISASPESGLERLLAESDGGSTGDRGALEELVRERLRAWQDNEAALIEFYSNRGLLLQVDGEGSIDDVDTAVQQSVGAPVGA